MRRSLLLACGVAALLLVFAPGCGGDDGDDAAPAESTEQTGNGEPNDEEEPAASGRGGRGGATLTIGDQTWTFDNYYCAMGSEETQNDRVSFSSGAFGSANGVRLQLDASIQDPEEQDRLEGDGVIHSLTINDIDDFQNPTVDWSSVRGIVGGASAFIQVSDGRVTAETAFDNGLTDEIEEMPGTLEAECGD